MGASLCTVGQRDNRIANRPRCPFYGSEVIIESANDALIELPAPKEGAIRPVAIGVNQTMTIDFGEPCPQFFDSVPTTITDDKGQDLPRIPRNRCPQPLIFAPRDTEFVHLNRIAPGDKQAFFNR